MATTFVPAVAPHAQLPFVKEPFSISRPPRRAALSRPVRMVFSVDTVSPPVSVDKSGLLSPKSFDSPEQCLDAFSEYFSYMAGTWNSERTYHYQLPHVAREDSQTTFDVERLRPPQVAQVLESNGDATALLSNEQKDSTQGFNVSFSTRMASQSELVRSSTNLAFVPKSVHKAGVIYGDYYRDLGYEESAPIKATFSFDCAKMELTMTTFYTRVVSVDQISLINQSTRLRRIVNYRRPPSSQPIEDVVLVGFGIERKSPQRLVS
ncbi:chorismate-binding protein [Gracilaria domingensis]|nr:chorismate-binding protein [Gracilaria domingensis]